MELLTLFYPFSVLLIVVLVVLAAHWPFAVTTFLCLLFSSLLCVVLFYLLGFFLLHIVFVCFYGLVF